MNPNGNPGNRGGGRKSAYQENMDADLLWEMFFGEMSRDEVEEKIKSGKYSLKDLWLSKGLAGNDRVLSEMFRKLFPDLSKRKVETEGGITVNITRYREEDSLSHLASHVEPPEEKNGDNPTLADS